MGKLKVQIVGETVDEIVEKMKKFISQMTPTGSVESDVNTATDATEKKPKKQNVKSTSKSEPAPEKAAEAPALKSAVAKDEVMKKIQAVSGKLGMAKAKEIVATHANGVGKIVDIKAEYFEAVANACDEALAG